MFNRVVLVDQNNNEIGTEDKLTAHKKGLLHRAFSIFIFNDNNQILLQKRSDVKYHSAGLWSNTCCSHPYNDKPLVEYANTRLLQEMGVQSNHFWKSTGKRFSKINERMTRIANRLKELSQ